MTVVQKIAHNFSWIKRKEKQSQATARDLNGIWFNAFNAYEISTESNWMEHISGPIEIYDTDYNGIVRVWVCVCKCACVSKWTSQQKYRQSVAKNSPKKRRPHRLKSSWFIHIVYVYRNWNVVLLVKFFLAHSLSLALSLSRPLLLCRCYWCWCCMLVVYSPKRW